MSTGIMIVILLISVAIAAGFLLALLWSIHQGQFDDDYSPAHRILFDSELKKRNETKSNT